MKFRYAVHESNSILFIALSLDLINDHVNIIDISISPVVKILSLLCTFISIFMC